jgi:hypothetical protein
MAMRSTSGRGLGLFVCVLALALASACSWTENDTRSATAGLPDVHQSLRAETWQLDPAASGLDPVLGNVRLSFNGTQAGGFSNCVAYGGAEVQVDDHTLVIGEPIIDVTECDAATQAALEVYFDALVGTHEVDVTDRDRLVLTRDDGSLELVADRP